MNPSKVYMPYDKKLFEHKTFFPFIDNVLMKYIYGISSVNFRIFTFNLNSK